MKKCKLGEIADFKTGPFGTQFKASEYTSSGYPVINVKNIGIGNIIDNDIDFISEETRERLAEHIIHEGDIVFARKGSVERHAYVRKEHDGWVQGSDCIKAKITDDTDPRYVSYFLHLGYVKQQLLNKAVGSTMPSMNTDILKDISIALPDKPEDGTTIANFLDKISNKIDNNQRIISTLESLSKTLYDYYFLQFDFPDEKGRPYKSSGGKMEYNAELGREIPAGWKVTCLKKYIDIGNGKDHSHLPNGDYPVYGSGGLMRRVNQFLYDKESVLIPRKGTLNNVMLVNGPFWTVDTMYYTILKNPNSINYVYQTVKLFNLEKLNTGSALPSMTANIIYNLKVPDAPLELINEYERATKKLLSKLRTTENENRHLTALRDFLLPLLMNGQVGFKK